MFVTLDVQDCKEPTIKFDNDEAAGAGTLDFAGTSGDGKDFELKLSLHTTIKPDECKVELRPRPICS